VRLCVNSDLRVFPAKVRFFSFWDVNRPTSNSLKPETSLKIVLLLLHSTHIHTWHTEFEFSFPLSPRLPVLFELSGMRLWLLSLEPRWNWNCSFTAPFLVAQVELKLKVVFRFLIAS